MKWFAHREKMRGSKKREAAARATRDSDLKKLSGSCAKRKRKRIVMCAADRDRIRQVARDAVAREKAFRKDARESYRYESGRHRARMAKASPRYSKAESDSLTIHNLPKEHVELFQELAHNFPITLAPDHRAELFLEWVEEHPDEVRAFQAERYHVTDDALAKTYAESSQADELSDAYDKARKLQLTAERAWERWEKSKWPKGKDRQWARERAELADEKSNAAWRRVSELEGSEAVPF